MGALWGETRALPGNTEPLPVRRLDSDQRYTVFRLLQRSASVCRTEHRSVPADLRETFLRNVPGVRDAQRRPRAAKLPGLQLNL